MSVLPGSRTDRSFWRVLVALYPPQWRQRYAEEMLAVLEDSASSSRTPTIRTAGSLIRGAAGAWLRPPRQLHSGPSRVRASVATVFAAWVALAAAALIFGQLNEDQTTATVTPGHSITHQLFAGYTLGAHISVGVLLLGGGPLYVSLVRAALRRHDRPALGYLALPLGVPLLFLVVLALISRAVRHPHGGVGAGWFLALTALGVLAGVISIAGPVVALRRMGPQGWPLRVALYGVGAAVSVMGVAISASAVDLVAVNAWGVANFVHVPALIIAVYCAFIAAVLSVALTSTVRGVRALRA